MISRIIGRDETDLIIKGTYGNVANLIKKEQIIGRVDGVINNKI